jgi:hypothetical protein
MWQSGPKAAEEVDADDTRCLDATQQGKATGGFGRQSKMLFTISVLTLLGIQSAVLEETPAFPSIEVRPVDEAEKDPSFVEFRKRLTEAIEKRDVDALFRALDDKVQCSFGGDDGTDEFAEMWGLRTNPNESRVWKELGDVLRLGGRFFESPEGNEFRAPYVFTDFPEELDPFEHGLVTGRNVRVRARPDSKSDVVATVSYLAVKYLESNELPSERVGQESYPWRRVSLPDGTAGYIWGKYVRSPIDYRAGFSKTSGAWKMTFFLAGD